MFRSKIDPGFDGRLSTVICHFERDFQIGIDWKKTRNRMCFFSSFQYLVAALRRPSTAPAPRRSTEQPKQTPKVGLIDLVPPGLELLISPTVLMHKATEPAFSAQLLSKNMQLSKASCPYNSMMGFIEELCAKPASWSKCCARMEIL